ncbi:hypothetical protein COCNU_06G007750 [Cocos nucifera]|uniref:Uncharacterized protein n=1 Tax=Cocos nucifera TaxID=13894 RepID=A0A8K0IB08_COCNU|nr:hypothetical protein COCNU_06G007750 [Cocos nucifera]
MSNSSDEGVLKLVHPGGFVEVHHRPVAASQVMAKNPRHCVARPDVFKFPWIVVRPESVLKPGRVFFIVPYRTLYRLLRSSITPRRALAPLPAHDPCHYADTVMYSNVKVFVQKKSAEIERVGGANEGKLKSCLKKENSERSQGRRVVFNLPEDRNDEGRQRRLMVGGCGSYWLAFHKLFDSYSSCA